MAPALDRIDHIHVLVSDRAAAEIWYRDVLGLSRVASLEFWAEDDGGPLMLADDTGRICFSLFERPSESCRSTIALGVDANSFRQWRSHLNQSLTTPARIEDHDVAWSLYFSDPDGNPFEITTYYHTLSAD